MTEHLHVLANSLCKFECHICYCVPWVTLLQSWRGSYIAACWWGSRCRAFQQAVVSGFFPYSCFWRFICFSFQSSTIREGFVCFSGPTGWSWWLPCRSKGVCTFFHLLFYSHSYCLNVKSTSLCKNQGSSEVCQVRACRCRPLSSLPQPL